MQVLAMAWACDHLTFWKTPTSSYRTSNPQSAADAELVVREIGIRSQVVDITPQVDAYFELVPDASPLRRGNKMARERMTILFEIEIIKIIPNLVG